MGSLAVPKLSDLAEGNSHKADDVDAHRPLLRPYQSRIMELALHENMVVVLPTGAGKTPIAAELIMRFGTPALFLVPTVLLVEQQAAALRNWTELDVRPYHGGLALPNRFHILVSTPKAFDTAQRNQRNLSFQWGKMKVVVFDEVHHLLKEHPYRKLAFSLFRSEARPRVIGLTASYSYTIGEKEAKAALQRLCEELRITNVETATLDELREGGYHAAQIEADISHASVPNESPEGVLPFEQRKPHRMMQMFFHRVLHDTGTAFSSRLTQCVLRLELTMVERDPTFAPPIQSGLPLRQWGLAANRQAMQCNSNQLQPLYEKLEHWYEALRLLIISWEEDEYAAVFFLRKVQCDTKDAISLWPQTVADSLREFWQNVPTNFRRLDNLKCVLIEKQKALQGFRGILFVQQRITTHILEFFIASDPQLKMLFSTASLYAVSSPATPSFSMTKADAHEHIQKFSSGNINLLISTVVAEEGIDIPSANCVIRFDAMQHAVSLVQSRGRARQENSAFVVLQEREDRPTQMLASAEKKQIDVIRSFKPKVGDEVEAKALHAQHSRERSAMQLLDGTVDMDNGTFRLQAFCQRTKVPLKQMSWQREADYVAKLTYRSLVRTIVTHGSGPSKKIATGKAALKMMRQLRIGVLSS